MTTVEKVFEPLMGSATVVGSPWGYPHGGDGYAAFSKVAVGKLWERSGEATGAPTLPAEASLVEWAPTPPLVFSEPVEFPVVVFGSPWGYPHSGDAYSTLTKTTSGKLWIWFLK